MATARVNATTGSLLAAVTSTANTLTSIVSTVDNSVSMLNDFVLRHRTMQAQKNIVELLDYNSVLLEETADRIAVRRKDTETKLADPVYSKHYQAAYEAISLAINPPQS